MLNLMIIIQLTLLMVFSSEDKPLWFIKNFITPMIFANLLITGYMVLKIAINYVILS